MSKALSESSCKICSVSRNAYVLFFYFTLTLVTRYLIEVSVSVPPDILDYPTSADMVVREGSNVSLRCAATGSPEPTIAWRREGGEPIPVGNGQEGKQTDYMLSHR